MPRKGDLVPPKALFVLSTGRVSTQFLARSLVGIAGNVVVEHEPLLHGYLPRRVFRNPRKQASTLARRAEISEKFNEIEALLSDGHRYIDTGWPIFAWIPYLQKRLGDRFEFVHLVRNPYSAAASLLTHGFFLGRANRFEKFGMIHGGDRNLIHAAIGAEWGGFTPFEKCLFHWLEVNKFGLECRRLAGFRGLVRFEDLFGADPAPLKGLLSQLAGRLLETPDMTPHDREQHGLSTTLELGHTGLTDAVNRLARRLGVESPAPDLDDLSKRYAAPRH